MDLSLLPEILASTIRLSVPLVLACLAGLWSEKSGIVDIGLEGKMLAAAFAAAASAAYFQSAWLGLLIAIFVSLGFSLVHGYAAINQRGNQVVSGVAINMLAAGLAVVLGKGERNGYGNQQPEPGGLEIGGGSGSGKGRRQHFALEANIDNAGFFRPQAGKTSENERHRKPDGGGQNLGDQRKVHG